MIKFRTYLLIAFFLIITVFLVQIAWAALIEGTNYGLVTSAPTADPEGAGSSAINSRARFFKVLATEAGTITEMGVYVNAVSEAANCQLGIYSSDEANNRAANRLAYSGDFAKGTTAGWKTAAVDYTFTADTNYFLGVQCDNTATVTWIDITGDGVGRSEYFTVQTELAASYGAPSGFGTFEISIYALYTPAGGGETSCDDNAYNSNWVINDSCYFLGQHINLGTGRLIIGEQGLLGLQSSEIIASGFDSNKKGVVAIRASKDSNVFITG